MATLLSLNYTAGFREGDWVNFTNFRYISSVALDQTTVYFGTNGGVIRYDRYANRWLDPMTITDGLPDNRIENIAYDPNYDRLWVSTPLGDAYYQPTFQKWYPGNDFPLNLARNDYRPGSLGALTTEFGYTYQDGVLSDLDFRNYRLTRGVDDGFDHLYVGTWGFGPVVVNSRYGDLKRLPFGPFSNDASALIRVGGKFWIGSGATDPEPGITLCDTSLQDWRWYIQRAAGGIGSTRISCAIGDGKTVWIGTDYGLLHYFSDNETFETFADFAPIPSVVVTSLAADSAWIYVGTESGLGYMSRSPEGRKRHKNKKEDSLSTEPSPLTGKNRLLGYRINALEKIDGYLYVASDRGVLRRRLGDYGDFELVNTPEKMLSDDIADIAKSGDSLLFATRNDIIVINTKTGAASTLTQQAYFGLWRIRKIMVDSGNVWAATSIGLWEYRLSDGYSRLFNINDGMISDNIRSIEVVGDYIWMATPEGVIRFYWDRPGRID